MYPEEHTSQVVVDTQVSQPYIAQGTHKFTGT